MMLLYSWWSEKYMFDWKSNHVQKEKETEHPYLFQYKLSYRNETGTNHRGLVSTLVWCFKIFLWGESTWNLFNFFFSFACVYMGGLYLTLIFFNVNPKFFNGIVKFTSQIAWKQIFTFLKLVWEIFDVGNIANASF